MKQFYFFIASFLLAQLGFAEIKKGIYFPPTKNGTQILQQKFEYMLLNDDQMQIGDILIDSNAITLSITDPDSQPKFKFTWPGAMFKSGQLVIKDHAGKGIWAISLNNDDVKLEAPPAKHPNYRDELAIYESEPISRSLIATIRTYPFVTFCLYRSEQDADLTLCSKEHFIPKKTKIPNFKTRSAVKKQAFVEINGNSVSNLGQIFLSGGDNKIFYLGQLRSGVFVEIRTNAKPLDFLDVVNLQGNIATMKARGAEPLSKALIKELDEHSGKWITEIDPERPRIYISAAGGVPLRQDILFKGTLPEEKFRPTVNEDVEHTYSDSISVSGKIPDKVTAEADSEFSDFRVGADSRYDFTLRGLTKREINWRYFKVKGFGREHTVGYEIYRGAANEVALQGNLRLLSTDSNATEDSSFLISGLYTHWWEQFFGSEADWAHFRWGGEVTYTANKSNLLGLNLHWRATPGLYNEDESWGLTFANYMMSANGNSISAHGGGGFYSRKSFHPYLGDWIWMQANILPIISGSGISSGSITQISWNSKYYLKPVMYWNWKLETTATSFTVTGGGSASQTQINLIGGMGYHF